jgi:hypothetical protein
MERIYGDVGEILLMCIIKNSFPIQRKDIWLIQLMI